MNTLKLDTSYLDQISDLNQDGIQSATVAQKLLKVESQLAAGAYGFVEILKDTAQVARITAAFDAIRWARTLVVVGIGGSDLGARVIQEAFAPTGSTSKNALAMEVLFHGDSTDPVQLDRLLAKIDMTQTVFNIISKSGETVETISQYVFLKARYQELGLEWHKHFLFTTDAQNGILRQEANQYGVTTLPIPDTVGGRFSVLTTVGLLPAVAMGLAISELQRGALDFAQDAKARKIAQEIATSHFLLHQAGTKIAVLMPYSIQLQEFGRWFRQLWAESLGKDGTGVLPIKAYGPADQHSQAQFYMQGEALASFLFIQVEKRQTDFSVPETDVPAVSYLSGHTFAEILNIERSATAQALYEADRPSATLTINELTLYSLGQLFMCFELAVVYLAELLEVNAFDQPGVEASKQIMYRLLGREGF